MGNIESQAKVKTVTISAVVTRANGKVENLGIIHEHGGTLRDKVRRFFGFKK